MAELILIVEDEHDLVATLTYTIEREGFATRTAMRGDEALKRAVEAPLPDLILLDVMLPGLSGTEVCRQLRQDARTRHVPVIMLTAKGDEIDRVVGFELGADDYMVKPFSVRELLLRIRAVLRRAAGSAPSENATLTFGRIRVDNDGHRTWVDEEEIILTALEFKLLSLLLRRRGRVQSRDTLLNDVWGIEADITTRTVDTHVKRLRQKLGAAGDYIQTLRGVGYVCRDRVDESSP